MSVPSLLNTENSFLRELARKYLIEPDRNLVRLINERDYDDALRDLQTFVSEHSEIYFFTHNWTDDKWELTNFPTILSPVMQSLGYNGFIIRGTSRNRKNVHYDNKEAEIRINPLESPSISLIHTRKTYSLPKAIYIGSRKNAASLDQFHNLLIGNNWCNTDQIENKGDYPKFPDYL